MNELLKLLARQVASDVRTLPHAVRARLTDEGRVARCVNVADLRALARRRVPRTIFDYVDGGAWDEVTLRRNERDFDALTILPRVLVDVSQPDTSTTLLGRETALPLVGAPTGLTGLVHYRGEVAIARALHEAGCIYTLATPASYSIEELAAEAPGPKWFQLYVFKDRGIVRALVERARAAGYGALVVTVDAARAGARERDVRNRFSIPPRITLHSCLDAVLRPRWTARFATTPRTVMRNVAQHVEQKDSVSLTRIINEQFDPALTWADIEWLRDLWPGPLVVKAILRPDDARIAAGIGVSGISVSNHGGRQLDHAPSAIRALPAVVDAVGGDVEVYLDGGIRRGTDIFKALALGARACLLGRALVYGVGAGGDAGARRAVQVLANELRLAMALAGCPSLAAVGETAIGAAEGQPRLLEVGAP